MKKVENCSIENSIPVPASTVIWNCGDITFLGICEDDNLCNVITEIVTKLEDIEGNDLSDFDIDALAGICNKKTPAEITISSILNLIKENEICIKDAIDNLIEQISELSSESTISANLKCYANFDNLGNSLQITRDEFDQLIIDNLCNHKDRIETLEGETINLQSQIDNLDIPDMTEQEFATCVDAAIKPTSSQVIAVAEAHCNLEEAAGTPADISSALANTPAGFNTEFGLIPGWDLTPENLAQSYGNLLLAFGDLLTRVQFIEENCCAASCADVTIGFSAVYNEDNTGVILKFTSGAGTSIPSGFEDIGSTITITDVDGNVETYTTTDPNLIANGAEIEISIAGLNLTGDLTVHVDANISNGSLTCSKCVSKTVKQAACAFCTICAEGADDASVVIIYASSSSGVVIENSTTTSSTTTTTTGL